MNLLTTYLRDISRYQPITLEQEQTLAQAARQGDMEARNQLIQAHLRMVVNIARQYLIPSIEILDLVQEGNIGLIKAVDMFDPSQGNRLSTIAFYWINKHIQRFLNHEKEDTLSLDMEINDGEECLHLSDTIADKDTTLGNPCYRNMDVIMEMQELQQQVNNLLATLPPREREVLRLLYGMNLRRSYTVSEVAKILRISKVRVCQLRDRALTRIHDTGVI